MDEETRPVALITGASRGIGKASAIRFAEAGFDVVVGARTLREGEGSIDTMPGVTIPGGLDTTVEAIEAHGVDGLAVRMDLMDRPSLLAGVDAAIERFGRIDVLMNNANYQGNASMVEFLDLDEEEQYKIFEGNLHAQLALIRAVLPAMIERGDGTIINMISATAHIDPPGRIGDGGWGMTYAATKAAFERVAAVLTVELGEYDIGLFSVDPGHVATEKSEVTSKGRGFDNHFRAAWPDVIGVVMPWLTTPDASHLRGKIVFAQRECKRLGLLPDWPPPKPT